jgi:hypothetical protein
MAITKIQLLTKLKISLLCYCLLIGCFSFVNLSAQEIKSNVISSGGKAVVSADIILSYTIGESIATVKTNNLATIIQGFEQPKFDTLSVGINFNELIIPIKIYPNPTYGPVYIDIELQDQIEWMLIVYNIDAKEILATSIFTGLNEISLNQYAAGTYALVFTTKEGEKLSSHLIEKIN